MDSANRPLISVVMPARNEGVRIHEAIVSLVAGRSNHFGLQIIVVDDASSDGSCIFLPEEFSWVRDHVRVDVIRLPKWFGIPYARNAGGFRADADTLFITDANVRFPVGWDIPVSKYIGPSRVLCATIADTASSFQAYGGRLGLPSMAFHWLRDPGAYGGYVPISPCTGTVISTDLFRRVGGYDTGMPVYGAAEPEFSVRLWLSGAEIVCVPELILQHRFRPQAEMRTFLDSIELMQVHNYLRFGLLYLDGPNFLETQRYYARSAPDVFEKALHKVAGGDVWQRRMQLESSLPNRFSFFARRFGLSWPLAAAMPEECSA